MITQKELFDYLKLNPLSVKVQFGDLHDLKGEDYIFVDLITDEIIGSDDAGIYKTNIQIVCATKNYDDRNTLVDYIKAKLNCSVRYDRADQEQYFLAYCDSEVIFNG